LSVKPASQESAQPPGVQQTGVAGSEPVFNLKPTQVNVTPEMPQPGISQIPQKAPEAAMQSVPQDQDVKPAGKDEASLSVKHPPPETNTVTGNQQVSGTQPMEPARLAEAHHPEIVEQLTRGIDTLTKSGEQSIRLQLYPENLGKIDLRLASGADGVRIVMHADSSVTSQLLERHMPELRQVLMQSGVNLSGLSIGYGNPQEQPPGFDGKRQNPWQLHKKLGGFLDLNDPETESQQKMESLSYVDYRV
jgi:flagellar hook-length control protein FliK